jgi:hypothetical protein
MFFKLHANRQVRTEKVSGTYLRMEGEERRGEERRGEERKGGHSTL